MNKASDRAQRKSSRADRAARVFETEDLLTNIRRRTAIGGMVTISGQLSSMLIQLVSAAIMSRLLKPEDFGVLAMAMAVTAFANLLVGMGLSTATVQSEHVDENLSSALFYINLIIGGVIMVALWVTAPIAAYLMGDGRILWVIVALSGTLPVAALVAQHTALLNRRMEFLLLRSTTVISQVAALTVGALLAWLTPLGYWALVANSWTLTIISTALIWYRFPWRPGRVTDWGAAKAKVAFGLHMTGAQIAFWVNRQLDNVLVGARWGATELGLYSRAYTIYMLPITALNGPVQSVVVPALSRLQSRPAEWKQLVEEVQAAVFLGAGAVASLLIANNILIVRVLLGPRWDVTAELLQILSLSIPPTMVGNTCGMIHTSLGRGRRMFFANLVRLPFVIVAMLIGLSYGAPGVAIAVSAVSFVNLVPTVFYATADTPVRGWAMLRRGLSSWLCIAVAVAATMAVPFQTKSPLFDLVVKSSLTASVYLAVAIILVAWDPAMAPLKVRITHFLQSRMKRSEV